MSEEKLRALLAEARAALGMWASKWSNEANELFPRIDAALAEPVAANPVAVAEMAALYHVGLSERILPSEAAPWVIEAIKLVERERDEARAEVAVLEKQNIELNDASVALEKQLAEARAEVERLRRLLAAQDEIIAEMRTPAEDRVAALEMELAVARDAAYQRGAEAMREAAAQDCIDFWGAGHASGVMQAGRIRALPVPEDKP